MIRHRHTAIVGLALAATLTAAGCSGSDPATGPTAGPTTVSSSAAADSDAAATELVAAAARLMQQPVKVTMQLTGAVTVTGVIDPKAGASEMVMTTSAGSGTNGTIRIRKLGKDEWIQFAGALAKVSGAPKDKWMRVDASALDAGGAFDSSGADPAATAQMLKNTANVRRTDDHTFTGTLDLTKAPAAVNSKLVAGMGAKAKVVPFVATTDARGWLSTVTVDLKGIAPGAGQMRTAYSDLGAAVTVQRPAAKDVVELPKQFKGLLGGN